MPEEPEQLDLESGDSKPKEPAAVSKPVAPSPEPAPGPPPSGEGAEDLEAGAVPSQL